jgi:hypothetical protein
MTKATLNSAEIQGIGYALDLAYDDQDEYLRRGCPESDYGDEWESAKCYKAEQFRSIAAAANKLGLNGETERWNALADEVMAIERTSEKGAGR